MNVHMTELSIRKAVFVLPQASFPALLQTGVMSWVAHRHIENLEKSKKVFFSRIHDPVIRSRELSVPRLEEAEPHSSIDLY